MEMLRICLAPYPFVACLLVSEDVDDTQNNDCAPSAKTARHCTVHSPPLLSQSSNDVPTSPLNLESTTRCVKYNNLLRMRKVTEHDITAQRSQ